MALNVAVSTSQPWLFERRINRLLALSATFSCILSLFRVAATGQFMYLFLVWNLFLGLIPYVISWVMERKSQNSKIAIEVFLSMLWLLFIPNSFYILTDLFHLSHDHAAQNTPKWFDLIMILSFAWNGLLAGMLSLNQVAGIFRKHFPLVSEIFFVLPVFWLSSLGVYIGRYLRYNSWDVITNPFALAKDIIAMTFHPVRFRNGWEMITCFTVLMTIVFYTLKWWDGERQDNLLY